MTLDLRDEGDAADDDGVGFPAPDQFGDFLA
jgi:hypothetical protein